MNKITKGKSIGMSLLAVLMACAMLVPAASALASTPANPTEATAGGPINPSYPCDPPPLPPFRPYLRTEFGADGAEVQFYAPIPWSQVFMEPSGPWWWRRWYSHGDVYLPHGAHNPFYDWPGCVVGRADTEARPRDGVTTTKVWVRTTLWRINWRGEWRVRATTTRWTTTRCPIHGDYDIDAYAGAEWIGTGFYAVTSYHRVYRDGVRTDSASQSTPATWVPDRYTP